MKSLTARALESIEQAALLAPWRSRAPALFLLGLPRSGTTLISQYLAQRAHLAYFTNRVGKHPGAPVVVSAAQSHFGHQYEPDYRSHYGRMRGSGAPREAGAVWMRFFPRDNYVGPEDVSPERAEALRRTVAALQCAHGGLPFFNKNVKHLLRLRALAAILPNAHFIVVRRPERDVALSILRARHKLLADAHDWWSVRPPEYAELVGRPVVEQVAGQVLGLRDQMYRDIREIDASRFTWIDYREFCARPDGLLERLDDGAIRLRRRGAWITSFETVEHTPQDAEERELVERVSDEE